MPVGVRISRALRTRIKRARAALIQRRLSLQPSALTCDRSDWWRSLNDPLDFYLECERFFYKGLPAQLRKHRAYFQKNGRGFGENAFHVMWFLLFNEFRPRQFLEIGVYRGQILSLASVLQHFFEYEGEVVGIAPFSSAGDSVSRYPALDYYEDILINFAHFTLPIPLLVKAFSTYRTSREMIASRSWDCIYIDGNHDYEIAREDWHICAQNTRRGGIIVLDDAGLTTCYVPPCFASGGHPGPSRVAEEIDRGSFGEILQVGHNRVFQKL